MNEKKDTTESYAIFPEYIGIDFQQVHAALPYSVSIPE